MAGRGRPKGSTTRRSIAVEAIVREKYPNYNPLTAMIKLAEETEDESIRLGAHKEVAQYLYPKRKAVEVSGPDGEAVQIKADVSGYEEAMAILKENGIDPDTI